MHQNQVRNEVLRQLKARGIVIGQDNLKLIFQMKDQGHDADTIVAEITARVAHIKHGGK
jgi:predicted secreted protein